MKKNLFALLFCVAFLFTGASVVKAAAPLNSKTLVKSSKSSAVNKTKLKKSAAMKMLENCSVVDSGRCDRLLEELRGANMVWIIFCSYAGMNCAENERNLLAAADRWEGAGCASQLSVVDRKKIWMSKKEFVNKV